MDGVTAVDTDDYTVVACAECSILKFSKKSKNVLIYFRLLKAPFFAKGKTYTSDILFLSKSRTLASCILWMQVIFFIRIKLSGSLGMFSLEKRLFN